MDNERCAREGCGHLKSSHNGRCYEVEWEDAEVEPCRCHRFVPASPESEPRVDFGMPKITKASDTPMWTCFCGVANDGLRTRCRKCGTVKGSVDMSTPRTHKENVSKKYENLNTSPAQSEPKRRRMGAVSQRVDEYLRVRNYLISGVCQDDGCGVDEAVAKAEGMLNRIVPNEVVASSEVSELADELDRVAESWDKCPMGEWQSIAAKEAHLMRRAAKALRSQSIDASSAWENHAVPMVACPNCGREQQRIFLVGGEPYQAVCGPTTGCGHRWIVRAATFAARVQDTVLQDTKLAEALAENARAREVFGRIANAMWHTCGQCFRDTTPNADGEIANPDDTGPYCGECAQGDDARYDEWCDKVNAAVVADRKSSPEEPVNFLVDFDDAAMAASEEKKQ